MRVVGCAFSQVKMNQNAIISQTKTLTVAIYFKTTLVSWGILSPFTPNTSETSVEYFGAFIPRYYLNFTDSIV